MQRDTAKVKCETSTKKLLSAIRIKLIQQKIAILAMAYKAKVEAFYQKLGSCAICCLFWGGGLLTWHYYDANKQQLSGPCIDTNTEFFPPPMILYDMLNYSCKRLHYYAPRMGLSEFLALPASGLRYSL